MSKVLPINTRLVVKFVFALVISVLAIAFAAGLIINRLLATPSGSGWLVNQALNYSDMQISWDEMTGNLIDGLELSGLVITASGFDLRAERLLAAWDFYGIFSGELVVDTLQVDNLDIQLLETESSTELSSEPSEWPSIELPIALDIRQSAIQGFSFRQGEIQQQLDSISFSGSLSGQKFAVQQLSLSQGQNNLQLSGELETDLPYQTDLLVNWQWQYEEIALAGAARLTGDLSQLQIEHSLQSPLLLQSSGSLQTHYDPAVIGLDPNQFEFDVLNSWSLQQAELPWLGFDLTSAGELQLEGQIEQVQIQASFDFLPPVIRNIELPSQSIALQASLVDSELSFSRLDIDSGLGRLSAIGDLILQSQPSWNFQVEAEVINPELILSEWEGQIDAYLSHQGSWTESGLNGLVGIQSFQGNIRGFPVSASGQLSIEEGSYAVRDLTFRQGQNQLSLTAQYADRLSAQWAVDAKNLQEVHPALSGVLISQGTASGSLEDPRLDATLNGQNLSFEYSPSTTFSTELVVAEFGITEGGSNYASAQFSQLIYADYQPSQLSLNIDGDLQSHGFDLSAEYLDYSLDLSGTGQYQNQTWTSELSEAGLGILYVGRWALEAPARLLVEQDNFQLESFCLVDPGTEICIQGSYSSLSGVQLSSQINRLQISTLKTYLPANAEFAGEISGGVNLTGQIERLSGDFSLASDLISMQVNTSDGSENYSFVESDASGEIQNGALSLSITSRLPEIGRLEGDISVDFAQAEKALAGQLVARFEDLGWLDPFFPDITDIEGQTDISLALGGTLSSPVYSGDLHLEQLSAYIPRLGINLEDGQLDLTNTSRNQWQVEGQLSSRDGQVELSGQLAINHLSDWNIQLQAGGESFQGYATEDITLEVSPDLRIDLSPQRLQVDGRVVVPSADILIRRLPQTTQYVSRDEIIVGGELPSVTNNDPRQIYADINLVMGDQVQFSGFDIEGRLSGELRLRESPNQPLRIDGTVEVIEGIYSAYGQELTIDPGRLIFNGAADNPSLNVRAFRRVGDNLVGVQIGGTVRSLSSSLYSSPILSSTETISLLVTGRPLSTASAADGQLLLNAVASLGLNQSSGLTQRLQNTLGLDVATISTDESLEESVVTVGKYLSPRLFVSYARDLLTPNASINLDYILSDDITINAKSGAVQSMDIFYRIER